MEADRKVDVYQEVLTAIVQRFVTLLGEAAVVRARRVYGLHVNDDGTVTNYQGDGMVIVQGVVIEYMTLLGPQAVAMPQRAISSTRERNPELKLPSLLK